MGPIGDDVVWFVPVAVIYSSQLTLLELDEPHAFANLAPFLPGLVHLTCLKLNVCQLHRDETVDWPQPTFNLDELSLYMELQDHEPLPSLVDFEWFAASSAESLRHFGLGGRFGNEIVGNLPSRFPNLQTALLDLRGFVRYAEGDPRLLGRIGSLPQLQRLELCLEDGEATDDEGAEDTDEARAIRAAADDVNKKLGRNLVVYHEWPVSDTESSATDDE
jgi:hypothetical protein